MQTLPSYFSGNAFSYFRQQENSFKSVNIVRSSAVRQTRLASCSSQGSDMECGDSTRVNGVICRQTTPMLRFSIEQILRPDFCSQKHNIRELSKEKCLECEATPGRVVESRDRKTTQCTSSDESEATQSTSCTLKCDLPAWIYCTRYTDRPAGMPVRRKRRKDTTPRTRSDNCCVKRSRTCFTPSQLSRLATEFTANRYLTTNRRTQLSRQLAVSELQVKIWFQNQRAKVKRSSRTSFKSRCMDNNINSNTSSPTSRDFSFNSALKTEAKKTFAMRDLLEFTQR